MSLRFAFYIASLFLLSCSNLLSFSGSGNGTLASPYQITDVIELQEMADEIDAHYQLMNDIDASATSSWNSGLGFDPVGDLVSSFTGSLDGQGYTISQLTIDREDELYVGLFGCISEDAQVYDVNITGSSVVGRDYVGLLCGMARSYLGDSYTEIDNCSSAGSVVGAEYVGGLVGTLDAFYGTAVIRNSSSEADVEANTDGPLVADEGRKAGGLVGRIAAFYEDALALVFACSASGDVSAYRIAGGFCGKISTSEYGSYCLVIDCFSVGSATTDAYYCGGFVGLNYPYVGVCEVRNSKSSAIVQSDGYAAGFCGANRAVNGQAIIRNCFSTGEVNPSPGGYDIHGGFCAINYGEENSGLALIEDCHARGDVSGFQYLGGFCGKNETLNGTAILRRCYSTGAPSGTFYLGGFCSENSGTGSNTIADCYWDTQTSGIASSAGGEGKTTAQMQDQGTFTNWDFDFDWLISSNLNNGYPHLQWDASCMTNLRSEFDLTFTEFSSEILRIEGEASFGGSGWTFELQGDGTFGGTLQIVAAESVSFLPGFKASAGASLRAVIDDSPCNYSFSRKAEPDISYFAERDRKLSLWPNPAIDRIYFRFESESRETSRYQIVDIFGSVLKEARVKGSTIGEIELAGLPSGVYFIRVFSADESATHKFVIVE